MKIKEIKNNDYGYYDPKDWRCDAKDDILVNSWVEMHENTNNLALKMSVKACIHQKAMTKTDGSIEKIFHPNSRSLLEKAYIRLRFFQDIFGNRILAAWTVKQSTELNPSHSSPSTISF